MLKKAVPAFFKVSESGARPDSLPESNRSRDRFSSDPSADRQAGRLPACRRVSAQNENVYMAE